MRTRYTRDHPPTRVTDQASPLNSASAVTGANQSHTGGARRRKSRIAWLARYQRLTFEGANGLLATSTLRKWLPIASLIGLVAGVGAIVFFAAIQWCTAFFQGTLLGYVAPSPLGEGTAEPVAMLRPWLLPVVVGMGGLLSGLIVFNLAPEAEGHGTDSAIAAYHYHEGFIRPRVPLVKLVASAITIGAGGSAGREGPTAQISPALGHC